MNREDWQSKTWLEPWHPFAAGVEELELAKEVSSAHPLFGIKALALARRSDRDDVLFFLPAQSRELAVVHLT